MKTGLLIVTLAVAAVLCLSLTSAQVQRVPPPPAPTYTIIPLKVASSSAAAAVPVAADTPAGATPPPLAVMRALRSVDVNDASAWRTAIDAARPALLVDADVQIQVGDMLLSRGDPIDGLAWQLLACGDCTATDERVGYGCAAAGVCDPNLALVDVFRRDYGEARVAEALARVEVLRTAIAANDPQALAPFTQIDDTRFPKQTGECVQLRTPTPECPPEEILRQTLEEAEWTAH